MAFCLHLSGTFWIYKNHPLASAMMASGVFHFLIAVLRIHKKTLGCFNTKNLKVEPFTEIVREPEWKKNIESHTESDFLREGENENVCSWNQTGVICSTNQTTQYYRGKSLKIPIYLDCVIPKKQKIGNSMTPVNIEDIFHQKLKKGPNPNGPHLVSCEKELLDIQVVSGSVQGRSWTGDFLDIWAMKKGPLVV